MARLDITPPRHVFDDIWAKMVELDAAGPWSVGQINGAMNVPKNTIRQLVNRLRTAGLLLEMPLTKAREEFEELYFRLVEATTERPHLSKAGVLIKEPHIETLWRSMKMVKTFTCAELAEFVPGAKRTHVKWYLSFLAKAGVLVIIGREGKGRATGFRYRLVNNLGKRAPKVLSTKSVYDPNSKTMLAEVETVEVQL